MKKLSLCLFACCSLLLALTACNGDDPSPVNYTLSLDRPTLGLQVGESFRLVATLTPAAEGGAPFVWTSDNEPVATVHDGLVEARAVGTATITVRWSDTAQADCRVTVSENAVAVTGIALDPTTLTLEIGDSRTLTATVKPDDATDKTVAWSSSDPTIASVNDGVVTALAPGNATVTATAGGFSADCRITVEAPQPAAPKIGDYFYSDGTWSDGGLVSIDADGLNPVWAEQKPAPESGKTVVGIVFQTASERIAESDRANGFTRGYVVAVKNAHGPNKPTTSWSFDDQFDCLKNAKTSDVWYWNVNGYYETITVRDTYGASITQCPAFDWTLNDFPLTAPEGTSGWFLPSTGQLWDVVANLCGHEVAAAMKEWSTQALNAGWGYASETVSYDVIGRFNESLAQLPADAKEELFVTSSEYYSTCSLWASTPCTAGETACIINIGTKGTIELYEEYIDGDCVARPILAF
jgi:hypothetical protein